MKSSVYTNFTEKYGMVVMESMLVLVEVGFELPDNKSQKLVFDAVLARLPHRAINSTNLKWLASDIAMVIIRHVPLSVHPPILIFYFLLAGDYAPERLRFWHPGEWYHNKVVRTTMFGSRERKTAWIFRRK